MLIEGTSKYLLKKVRTKAKMYEYHIPEELHGVTEKEVADLLILAIATIGDFSNDIVKSFDQVEIDYEEHQKSLRFSSKFFDAYLDSKLFTGDKNYYLLLGAIVYYLCNYNGSSKVLSLRIEQIDLKINGIDSIISQILKGEEEIKYYRNIDVLIDIVNSYNNFLKTGVTFDFNLLKKLKRMIYELGSDRELLFSDALIAIIYLKVKNSTYQLMPEYTNVDSDIWRDIIQKGTLITELWQSQRELGNLNVFRGNSATIQMPTSSGKTKSVALIILSAFLRNQTNQAIVVAPFRSLCREIRDELSSAFSFSETIHVNELSDVLQMDILDLLFGKSDELDDQYIYVVTPEKLLFVLRQNITILANVGLIIFDEGHLFDDITRGITYELLISTIKLYMSNKTQKILISAVIPNAEEINGWLTAGEGIVIKNNVIQTTEKAVGIAELKKDRKSELWYTYLYFLNPENPDDEEFYVPRVIKQMEINKLNKERNPRIFPEINNGKNKNRNDMAIALAISLCVNGGTALFCGKKETADKILGRILDIRDRGYDISNLAKYADAHEVYRLSNLIENHLGRDNDYYKASLAGAFIHHGNIPMGIRCAVEYAMQKGKINFLTCTSTLSQGVNLPIRYLIIPNAYQGKERIKVRDFQNLIGRAGRAGIYTEGTILLSETGVYREKNNQWGNWKWLNYKQLLNSNQAEACTSELLVWLRVDDEMEDYLKGIMDIFVEYYALGNFTSKANDFLETIKSDKEETTYSKAEIIVSQMIHNIEAIESFMLFYLMDETYDDSKEDIHNIIKETLAYYLASAQERDRLLHIVDLIGNFLVEVVNTPDKRNRYSKSLLGVKKEIEIEDWVNEHLFDILGCDNEEEILEVIFPMLMNTDNTIIKNCNSKENLTTLGIKWISGESYIDIQKYCEANNIRTRKKTKMNIISLEQIISVCDNFLGYECTLVLSAIIENVSYNCDDLDLIDCFKLLSKRLRYGVIDQCSISLYEMGFNDRVISTNLANIVESEYRTGSRKEITKLIRQTEYIQDAMMFYLESQPSYFYDKARILIDS